MRRRVDEKDKTPPGWGVTEDNQINRLQIRRELRVRFVEEEVPQKRLEKRRGYYTECV